MKKIVCIDSWTQGYHLYDCLVEDLKNFQIQLILIHFGSWGHDKGRKKEEFLGKLLVRDVSYYESSISKILDDEKPDAVLFTSTRSLIHMSVNRLCKIKGIKTIHMINGVIGVLPQSKSNSGISRNHIQMATIFLKRFYVNILVIIPFSFFVLFRTNAHFKIWKEYFLFIFRQFLGQGDYVYDDAKTDYGIVYSKSEKSNMFRLYEINFENIYVMGNPDWYKFLQAIGDKKEILETDHFFSKRVLKSVLYIDTALSKSGMVFRNDDEFILHIQQINIFCKYSNIDFSIKLHPAHHHSTVQSRLHSLGIKVLDYEAFANELMSVDLVLVEQTSLALIPAFCKIPLGLVKIGKLHNETFGSTLLSYPRSFELSNIDEMTSEFMKLMLQDNLKTTEDWIELHNEGGEFNSSSRAASFLNSILNG